jgi:UDP-N-acetylmuramoyl-tripeptide--D-alanyl-D-alanine ligase
MTVKLCERLSPVKESVLFMTLGEIASMIGARCSHDQRSVNISSVTTDSREDCSGALFVALKGDTFDGHAYLADAFTRGAIAAIVSETIEKPEDHWRLLKVDNTLNALVSLAAGYRRKLPIPVVAITGSCGKTTTKEFLAAALTPKYRVAKPRASFNNLIGVSLTILSVRPEHEVLILEMGTNAPGEIRALCDIGRPTMGIITNIGHTHLERLGSVEGVKKEKASLAESIEEGGVLVTNIDCPECGEIAEEFGGQVVTVAVQEQADHRVGAVSQVVNGTTFKYDGRTATVPVSGGHNALNAGLAVAAAEALDVEKEEALSAIATAKLPGMRMQGELTAGVLIINDAYNSNFESLKAAVQALDNATVPGRKILVCGDMLELGKAAEALHRAIGWHIGRTSIDVLVTAGENSELVAMEAHKSGTPVIFQRASIREIGDLLELMAKAGDAVLFKASRGVHLEQAVQQLRRALIAGQNTREK